MNNKILFILQICFIISIVILLVTMVFLMAFVGNQSTESFKMIDSPGGFIEGPNYALSGSSMFFIIKGFPVQTNISLILNNKSTFTYQMISVPYYAYLPCPYATIHNKALLYTVLYFNNTKIDSLTTHIIDVSA